MTYVLAALAAFALTTNAMLALRPLAKSLDLVDRPGGHKTHHGRVPLVGGLAMFLGASASLGLFTVPGLDIGFLIGAFSLLVGIGLLDDRFVLPAWMRLVIQGVAASLLVVGTGAVVRTLGSPFGNFELNLGGVGSIVFSVVLITAAVNAFNMLDGIDGLAGISALAALLGLGALAHLDGGLGGELMVCAVMSAAVCGFLLFNIPVRANRRVRCFMGDAGSTLLGVAVAWLCIRVSQYAPAQGVRPVSVLWMVAIPLYELLWTVIRRIISRRSPMRADREHCHHLLIRAGLTVKATFLILAALEILFVLTGLLLQEVHVSDPVSFILFTLGGVATVRFMYQAKWIADLAPLARRQRRHEVEAPSA